MARPSVHDLMMPDCLKAITPPDELTPEQKEMFISIVNSVPKNYFLASDIPLLASYVVHIILYREAAENVTNHGQILVTDTGRSYSNPAVRHMLAFSQNLAMLSQKLRLNPSARITRMTGTPGGVKPPKPWESGGDGEGDPVPAVRN